LPRDTPAGKKESLDAATAPRRLTFLPNLGDCQIVGQVSYRSRDTAGRPGSYFADILVGELGRPSAGRAGQRSQSTEGRWSPAECLRLWSADHDGKSQGDWWCDSEERLTAQTAEGRGVPIAPSGGLADVRSGGAECISDAAFWSFLNTAPGGDFDDLGRIIPPRWRDMSVEDRQSLVANLLQATINLLKNRGRGNVVVAVEPSVAALLFYGLCRLLPESLTIYSDQATGISFSTYEPFPERPMTNLLATTFFDIENPSNDLPAEVYQRGFACNTFRDPFKCLKDGRELPRNDSYVQHILQLATDGHAPARDHADEHELLLALNSLSNLNVTMLDQLVELDRSLAEYTRGVRPWADVSRTTKPPTNGAEAEFLRKRFQTMVEAGARQGQAEWPPDLLQRAVEWLGDELVAEDGLWSGGHPESYRVLVGMLPTNEAALKDFLSSKSVTQPPDQVVVEAVVSVAHRGHKLPDCLGDFLTEREKAGRTKGTPTFFQTIIARLDENQLSDILLNSNPDVHADRVLSAITGEGSTLPKALVAALSEKLLVKVLDDGVAAATRWRLLAGHSSMIKLLDRPIKPELQDRLDRLFSGSSPQSGLRNQPPAVTGSAALSHLQEWAELTKLRSDNVSLLTSWQHFYKSFNPLKEELAKGRPKTFGRRTPQLNRDKIEAVASSLLRIRGFSSTEPLSEPVIKQCLSVFRAAMESRVGGVPSDMRPQLENVMQRHLVDALASQSKTERTIVSPGRLRSLAVGRGMFAAVSTVLVVVAVFTSNYKVSKKERDDSPSHQTQPEKVATAPPARPNPESTPSTAPPPPTALLPPTATAEPQINETDIDLEVKEEKGGIQVSWNHSLAQRVQCTLLQEIRINGEVTPEQKEYKIDSSTPSLQLGLKFGEHTFTMTAGASLKTPVKQKKKIVVRKPVAPDVRSLAVVIDRTTAEPQLMAELSLVSKGDRSTTKYMVKAMRGSHEVGSFPGVHSDPRAALAGAASARPDPLAASVRFGLPKVTPEDLVSANGLTFQLVIETSAGPGLYSEPRTATFDAAAEISTFIKHQVNDKAKLGVKGVYPLQPDGPAGDNGCVSLIRLPSILQDSEMDLVLLIPKWPESSRWNLKVVRIDPTDSEGVLWQVSADRPALYLAGDTTVPSKQQPSVKCGEFYIKRKEWQTELQFRTAGTDALIKEAVTRLSYCKLGLVHRSVNAAPKFVAVLQMLEPIASNARKFSVKKDPTNLKSIAYDLPIPTLANPPEVKFDPPPSATLGKVTVKCNAKQVLLYVGDKIFAEARVEVVPREGRLSLKQFKWTEPDPAHSQEFPGQPFKKSEIMGLILLPKIPYKAIEAEFTSSRCEIRQSSIRNEYYRLLKLPVKPLTPAELLDHVIGVIKDDKDSAYSQYVDSCVSRTRKVIQRYADFDGFVQTVDHKEFPFAPWSIEWNVELPNDVKIAQGDVSGDFASSLVVKAIVCEASQASEVLSATSPTADAALPKE
jgi:hypothetical protein